MPPMSPGDWEALRRLDSEDDVKRVLADLESRDDPLKDFQMCCSAILAERGAEPLLDLASRLPEGHFGRAVVTYSLATKYALARDLGQCDRLLQAAALTIVNGFDAIRSFRGAFQFADFFLQYAFYFDPTVDVRRPVPPFGDVERAVSAPPVGRPGPIVVAAANGLYVETFGEAFVAAIPSDAPVAGVHVHVIDPTPDTEAMLARLAGTSPVPLWWSTETGPRGMAYLICARFFVAARLMELVERDTIVVDLDGAFRTTEAADIARILPRDADAGLFEGPALEVGKICSCALSYWRHSGRTRLFLTLLTRYMTNRLNLSDQYWLLDQIAVFVLSRRVGQGEFDDLFGERPFAWADLSVGFEDRTRLQRDFEASLQQKIALRRAFQGDYLQRDGFAVAIENGRLVPAHEEKA